MPSTIRSFTAATQPEAESTPTVQANTKTSDTTAKLTYSYLHVSHCARDHEGTHIVDFLYPWQQRACRPIVPTGKVERPAESHELDTRTEVLCFGRNLAVRDTRAGGLLHRNGIARKVAQFDMVVAGSGGCVSWIDIALCGLHALTGIFLQGADCCSSSRLNNLYTLQAWLERGPWMMTV